MKLVTFVRPGEERLGFLHGDAVVDPLLAAGDRALFGSTLAFIRAGDGRSRRRGRCSPIRRRRPASR